MKTIDAIKKELAALIDENGSLLKLTTKDDDLLEFGTKYQNWYTRSLRIVQALASDRLVEFVGYYQIDPKRKAYSSGTFTIQDYVMGKNAPTDYNGKPNWDKHNVAAIRFYNQVQILSALTTRIDHVLSDVTGALFAELQDHELQSAHDLLKVSVRAAGALAGVVLERHLQRVAQNHQIAIGKKTPTLSDLNDPLKNANIYDIPTWRKIQLLGDIRNLCSHQKGADPTKQQVEELIAGVNSIIKTIF